MATSMSPGMTVRRILDAGSGANGLKRRPSWPSGEEWEVISIDVDPRVNPDYVGSVTDMKALFADASFDIVWSSHSVEHLYLFELEAALQEFRRVLKCNGFALITCPDVEAVAEAILVHGLDHVAYVAPAGPITLHDILYGHTASIVEGATAMAHRTGLTAERLGNLAVAAGFTEAIVGRGTYFDLWAVLRMPETNLDLVKNMMKGGGAEFLFRHIESGGNRSSEKLDRTFT